MLLDLLGHGRSDKPPHASEYRIDTYAEQVFALLDELGVESAVLGGMSLGANVSLFAASQRPDRVSGLVLEMPVLEWAVPSAALLFAPLLLLAHYGRWIAAPGIGRCSAGCRRRGVPAARQPACTPPVRRPRSSRRSCTGSSSDRSRPPRRPGRPSRLPTLVLAHRNDLIHPFDDATNLAEQLPHATLQRARSPLELRLRPDRLTDVIATFLDDVWSEPVGGPGRTEGRRHTPPPRPRSARSVARGPRAD